MFGDLFEEEDFAFLSISSNANYKKSRPKDLQTPDPRGSSKLSGLRNQGSTCYLNSLLQTLLYTPEFREALFALGSEELGSLENKDVHDSKVRIIPLQLQRLFAQLLLLDQQAASTTDLTSSFGWNSSEETGQHDVQELNRILFSALESSLEGTSGHDLIQRLYHGTLLNCIKCLECGHTSERQEDFLDVTVAVKGMSSLEESLCSMYLEEERFEGDNLYRCGACDQLVPAVKSAKLKKLPPFLTVSLLRFNFDFTKCERYKETSRYTFPTLLNLLPFCEQHHLEDSAYSYELFSVIIHKGGCYGGHYHVYIRDVDQLGHWDCQDQEKETTGAGDSESDPDGPAVTLASIIAEAGGNCMFPVDQLGQKLLEHTGASWNKTYRKQHGAIRKFLQSHASIFQLSSDGSLVGLTPTVPSMKAPECPSDSASEKNQQAPEKSPSHWFDFNDSSVQPIREKDIEKQFQGKESAYMLFYRKSQLKRPHEALGNCHFGVPEHFIHEMNQANEELQRKRLESNTVINSMELQLHLSAAYQFVNGALHPAKSSSTSVLEITVNRCGTVGDLKQLVFQLLNASLEGQVLSIAKVLPAGLHIFQELENDCLDLASAGVTDKSDLFLWDGKEVGGLSVPTGENCAPLLLTIQHQSGYTDPSNPYTESLNVFPSNMCLSDMQKELVSHLHQDPVLCYPSTENSRGWTVFAPEDMSRTLRDLGLKDGSSVLLLDTHGEGELTQALVSSSSPVSDQNFLHVEDWRKSQVIKQSVQIFTTFNTTISNILIMAIEMMGPHEVRGEDTCLRPVEKTGKLLPPMPENMTVQEAKIKPGCTLALCKGKTPDPSQIFLYFLLETDLLEGREQEIILEETVTIRETLEKMLKEVGLSGEPGWHLRKMDWCYEAGEPLTDQEATLRELKICTGDTLIITEGRIPPKGFLKLPIWLYSPQAQHAAVNHMTLQTSAPTDVSWQDCADSQFCFAGDIEICENASLQELKLQIMTLPFFEALEISSPKFLRIWTFEYKHMGKILRPPHQKISDFKLGSRTPLCAEPLDKEECLGPQDLLLRVQLSVPGERCYFPAMDVVWDFSRGCTGSALRQIIAAHCSLPADKVEIAKYLSDKHEWLLISSWTQQVSKKRKKKNDSLKGAPYHLKDGDIIGVKNLLLDNTTDFSSETDLIMREKLQQCRSEEGTRPLQSDPVFCNGKSRSRVRKPETPLSIRVGVFR
ncbi:ubiquitin carboxyl-terminal hydrolase 40 [Bombina bombina]|uniref:ubiquitin carboxyl-terminal hydrolase 40 n=1 Tax=Bombina bombina TaxID=8345 RepID=UPI00235B0AB4|nr:ubiquitin carboxyl-terminal hydrolase 40 [Bombina bombina]XP_053554854.1 ubiquitin carboxyl-terminal hydrolase 40 [Bombina bombina]